MKNVLIIAPCFPPENVIGAARPYRFYKFLSESGFNSHVITASAPDSSRTLPNVTYVPDPSSSGLRGMFGWNRVAPYLGLNRGMHWVRPAVRAARSLAAQVPISAILSTVPPFNGHLVGRKIQRELAVPWIADFRDPFFFDPSPKASMARLICTYWERRTFQHADAILSVHQFMIDEWTAKYAALASKFHFFPNGFDPDETIGPLPVPPRAHKVLLHVGSLYGERSPKLVLASICRLIRARILDPASIRIRLVGDAEGALLSDEVDDIELLRRSGCLECVPEQLPRAEALRELGEADYLLLLDNFAGWRPYGLPGKIFEYVQMGRPILAVTFPDSPVETLLRKSGSRYRAIRPDAPPGVVDSEVTTLLGMTTDPICPSQWFYTQYDGRRQVGCLAGLLDRLTGMPPERRQLLAIAGSRPLT